MGKKYFRFMVKLGGGIGIDDREAYEVLPGKIVTYRVESVSTLFKTTHSYTAGHTMPITSETTVELRPSDSPEGGVCVVRNGKESVDYNVYGSARDFVAEIYHEISRR